MGGGPALGGEAAEGFGGLGGEGEAGEQIGEVGLGVDPGAVAVADQGVERGGTVAAFGVAYEEPVLFADGGGADSVFRQIVVDPDAAVGEEHEEFFPLPEGVGEGEAGEAFGQVFAPGKEVVEPGFDLLEKGEAVGLAIGPDGVRPGAAVLQPGFDAVEVLDLQEEPRGVFAFGFGFEKFAPDVGHAPGQLDGVSVGGALFGEGWVGAVAIALDDALKFGGDDAFQTGGAATGAPGKVAEVPNGVVEDPKVAGAADAFAFGVLVFDGGFVSLNIAVGEDFLFGGGEDEAAGFGSHAGPAAQGLAGERDAGAGVELLDAVIRKVLFEAEDESVGEEARSGDAAGLELI